MEQTFEEGYDDAEMTYENMGVLYARAMLTPRHIGTGPYAKGFRKGFKDCFARATA